MFCEHAVSENSKIIDNDNIVVYSSVEEKLDDQLCTDSGLFHEHYSYLMDEKLIETCQVKINKKKIYIYIYI